MTSINSLISELDERNIARRIGIKHDEARMRYSLPSNIVKSFEEFNWIIGNFLSYQVSKCISHGGSLSTGDAASWAKEIVEGEYKRRGSDIVGAFNDAHDGTNGGLRAILDVIAESLKAISVERFIRDAFDRYVTPNSWNKKVEIIRQFIVYCGNHLSSSIRRDQPESYAHNYKELIHSYVTGLQQTSSIFRRL